ncbi:MAG: hypothetical protein ACYC5H_05085 [Methylovirgula sp.]
MKIADSLCSASPILRANILFRRFEVLTGHYHVEFSFEPLSGANFAALGRSLVTRVHDK